MNGDEVARVDHAILTSTILLAVREYRSITGSELDEAIEYVNARSELLDTGHREPDPVPPPLDQTIVECLTEIQDSELVELKSICDQLETVLYGLNYQVTVEAAGREYSAGGLPINEIMRVMYPYSEPHLATLTPIERETMEAAVTASFNWEGDSGSGPNFTPEEREKMNAQLLPSLIEGLARLAPSETSDVYSYSSDVGLPGYYTYWFEAYVLHDTESGTVLCFTAVASD